MKNILIVEDERAIALTLAHALQRASQGEFTVEVCNTGSDAMVLLPVRRFDVLISDLKLPGMSGLELIELVRRIQPETHTILMTGFGSAEVEAQTAKLGTQYLTKPFNVPDVLNLVRRLLGDMHHPGRVVHVESRLQFAGQLLSDLCSGVGAPYALLLDFNGNTLIDSGNAGEIDARVLNALLVNSMAAAHELARAFSETHAFDLHYYDGEHYEIYCRKIDDTLFLGLVLDLRVTTARMGSVWVNLKRTVEALRQRAVDLQAVLAGSSQLRGETLDSQVLARALDHDLFGVA